MDTWELTVKAADCDLVNNELILLTAKEKKAYLEKFCVDFAKGEEKP